MQVPHGKVDLNLLSIVIPARDDEACIADTVSHLSLELKLQGVSHEIIVVVYGSVDKTWHTVQELSPKIPELIAIHLNDCQGFGIAVAFGIDQMKGDAVVIMMGDESDDCRDTVRYWHKLREGYDCVFGSRFMKNGSATNYPWIKLIFNRIANLLIKIMFGIKLNDTTNAFKAYRRTALDGCRPFLAPHFNLTVELPLKAIVRGFSWTVIPINWTNRGGKRSRFELREMGSRYLFIFLYVWFEKHFSHGDYLRRE